MLSSYKRPPWYKHVGAFEWGVIALVMSIVLAVILLAIFGPEDSGPPDGQLGYYTTEYVYGGKGVNVPVRHWHPVVTGVR